MTTEEVAYEIADGDKFKENVNVSTVKAVRDALQATSELKYKVVEKFSFKDSDGYWKEVGDEQSAPIRYQGKVHVRVNLQKGQQPLGGGLSTGSPDILEVAVAKLESVGSRLTEKEKNVLQKIFVSEISFIAHATVKAPYLRGILRKLQNYCDSSTKANIETNSGYIFDGLVTRAGQGTTVIVYAFRGTRVYCAKIGAPNLIQHEYHWAQQVDSPVIMKFIEVISIDPQRSALISPLFPCTLRELISAMSGPAPVTILINIILCGFSAICSFSSAGVCYGDIKPGNIAISNTSNNLTVLDFGSCRNISATSALHDNTAKYLLDIEVQDTVYLDRVCLFATVCEAASGSLSDGTTRRQALSQLSTHPNWEIFKDFARPLIEDTISLEAMKLQLKTEYDRLPSDVRAGVVVWDEIGL